MNHLFGITDKCTFSTKRTNCIIADARGQAEQLNFSGLRLELEDRLRVGGAVVLTFAFQMATIYVPFLNPIFHTIPLTMNQLGLCLLLQTVVFYSKNGCDVAASCPGSNFSILPTFKNQEFIRIVIPDSSNRESIFSIHTLFLTNMTLNQHVILSFCRRPQDDITYQGLLHGLIGQNSSEMV